MNTAQFLHSLRICMIYLWNGEHEYSCVWIKMIKFVKKIQIPGTQKFSLLINRFDYKLIRLVGVSNKQLKQQECREYTVSYFSGHCVCIAL